MKEYMEVYRKNKILDDMFMDKYNMVESSYYEKNCLELIVELCELANESKCFKYWTVKKPVRENVLEEYADCMLMILYFFNTYGVEKVDTVDIDINADVLVSFNEIVRMCTMLMNKNNVNERLLKEIFTYLLHIGKLLKLSDNEILDACFKKIRKNEERLNSNY